MNNRINDLNKYHPFNIQEENDKKVILNALYTQKDIFSRENLFMHFTSSCWIVNPKRDKVLMIYHKIYDSWSWLGGHADGNENLLEVAIKEMKEESGIMNYNIICSHPFSIEVLTVDGHIKKGKYVNSHLHLNFTYLFEVDENETLIQNKDETNGVKWIPIEQLENEVSEKWFMKNVYQKLINKVKGEDS